MRNSVIASVPPPPSTQGDRSKWGDFSQSAQADVARALLDEVQGSAETVQDALVEAITTARKTGMGQAASETLLQLDGNSLDVDSLMPALIELFYFNRKASVLKKFRVVHPAYRIYDDHYANAEEPGGSVGVAGKASMYERRWSFLGHDIAFPVGVGASGLTTNSSCVQRLFRGGYNVVTYKTVRSREIAPFSTPNWAFLSSSAENDLSIPDHILTAADAVADPALTSTANSFGVPSYAPELWVDDLRMAIGTAGPGQLLICSVLGEDYSDSPTSNGLIEDFVAVSLTAVSAGSTAIELNVSCPNTLSDAGAVKPPLCTDASLTESIVKSVKSAMPTDVRIGVKLSCLGDQELESLLDRIAGSVDFVTGINTVQRAIKSSGGVDFFPGRSLAGVGGAAIAGEALRFVQTCDRYRKLHRPGFDIIGLGGVTDVGSFQRLYDAGADVVQSVSGVFRNSLLAQDCAQALSATLRATTTDYLKRQVLRSVRAHTRVPAWRVYASVAERPALIEETLHELVSEGLLALAPSDLKSDYAYSLAHSDGPSRRK